MLDRHNHDRRLLAAVIAAATLMGGTPFGAPAAASPLFGRKLHKQLDQPLGAVLWSATPLRTALDDLSQSQNVALWLDRQIDPDQRISLTPGEVPLKNVLARLAREHDLGITLFRSVVYLGPTTTTKRLRTLGALRRDEARRLSPEGAQKWLRVEPMEWEELATPRELLARLAEKNDFEIKGLDRVVHDLWPAAKLPPMTLADRLTLILAPLELTYRIEGQGSRIRLVPMPDRVVLTKKHPPGIRPENTMRRWKQLLPEADIRLQNGQIVVTGRMEDHERLENRKTSATVTKTENPKSNGQNTDQNIDHVIIQEIAFKNQPLEAIVRQMASRLNLQLQFDAQSLRREGFDLDRRISIDLKNVSVDRLFKAMLEPSGLTFQRDGSLLKIRAKRP